MGRLYGGYHELLAFFGGGGGAEDPLAPLPCSAAYAQTVCSDKKISRV